MIFTLDRVGAISIVTGIWLLSFFLYLSSRRLGFGDADDPHFNFLRPENDVNVCNFKLPLDYVLEFVQMPLGTSGNIQEEIDCYIRERVTAQAWVLWKGCRNTLYHVLSAANARSTGQPTLRCVVFVDKINGESRTTFWGSDQHDRLKTSLTEAVNEWNQTLSSTEPEFYKGLLDLEIVCVCEADEDGKLKVYESVDSEFRETSNYDSFSGLGVMNFEATYPELQKHNVDISIIFQSSDGMGSTYGYVSRMNYYDLGFTHGMCFYQGVTVVINDTMMDGTVNRNAWLDTFIPYFLLFGCLFVAALLMIIAPYPFYILIAFLCGAVPATMVSQKDLSNAARGNEKPPLPGHPTRFASDVFPTSLLTHELGHTLLMMDHYKAKYAPDGNELSWSLPGPLRPFKCGDMQSISIMGAENYVTSLDKQYVRSMWRMLKSSTLEEAIQQETEPDKAKQIIPHTGQAKNYINTIRSRGLNTCARLNDMPYSFPSGNTGSSCKTNKELAWLYDRSAYFQGGKYNPTQLCNPKIEKRVKLGLYRRSQQQLMHNSYILDFTLAIVFTFQLFRLYQENVAQDLADFAKMNYGRANHKVTKRIKAGELKYRALIPNAILLPLWGWILFSIFKAREMAKCVERENTWINTVYGLSFLLLIPLIPLTLRRTAKVVYGYDDRLGIKRYHVQRNERGNPIQRGIGFAAQETARTGAQFERLKRIYNAQKLGQQASKQNRLRSGADLVTSAMRSKYLRDYTR
jgi:hypothetical protein